MIRIAKNGYVCVVTNDKNLSMEFCLKNLGHNKMHNDAVPQLVFGLIEEKRHGTCL